MELQLVEGDGGRVRDTPLALVVGQLRVDGLDVVEEHGRVDGVVRAVLHAAAVPSVANNKSFSSGAFLPNFWEAT